MKSLIAVLALLLLAGCASTDPGDAAGIAYRLPRTDVTVSVGLDVTECAPAGAQLAATYKIDPVAGAQEGYYHVAGSALSASTTKRALTIDVDTTGVISSVNTTTTDQGVAIIGDVIKIAATAATFAAKDGSSPVLMCNATTAQAFKSRSVIKQKISGLQATLAGASDPGAVQKQIDPLAAQLVAINASLHKDLSAKVALETGLMGEAHAKALALDLSGLNDWFDTAYVGASPKKQVTGIAEEAQGAFAMSVYYEDEMAPADGLKGVFSTNAEVCKLSLTIPASHYVRVHLDHPGAMVTGVSRAAGATPPKPVVQLVPASQLAAPTQLCLSTRLGENRVVGLKFDAYGRTTEFSWTADARVANVANALAGSASDAGSIVKSVQGASVAKDKADLDKLTTEQSLRKARACQALLDAGAASCP